MQNIVIIEPLNLASSYGNRVKCKIRVGKLDFELSIEHNDKTVLTKPDKLKTLEEAGMELDYSVILQQYKAILDNLDEFRATEKERKARHQYQKSEVAKMELPKIDGVTIRIETEDEYATKDRGYGSLSEPTIFVTIDGFESKVRYKDTDRSSWRSSSNSRMRFVVSNAATERRERQYTTLKACINKLQTLVPQYLSDKKAKENRKTREAELKQRKQDYIRSNFPEAIKENWGDDFVLNVNRQQVNIATVWDNETETYLYFRLGRLPFDLTKKQVEAIVNIVKNTK